MKTIIILAIAATSFAAIAGTSRFGVIADTSRLGAIADTSRFGQDQSFLSFPYWVQTTDAYKYLRSNHGNGSKTIDTSCRSWC